MKTSRVVFILVSLILQCSAQLCDFLAGPTADENCEISPHCLKQLIILCNNESVLWRMFDASSKYPIPGMSYSNNKHLGNFDECIDINYENLEGTVKGKFCALNVAINNVFVKNIPYPLAKEMKLTALVKNPIIKYNHEHMTGHNNSIKTLLSLCIPDACTPKEVRKFFIGGDIFTVANIGLVNFVDTVPCMTKESNTDFKWGDTAFITFLTVILFLIACSTAYDVLQKQTNHPLFLSFSLITNGRNLLNVDPDNPEQIQCLKGLRFISMMWVMALHGFKALESVPLINHSTINSYKDQLYTQYIESGRLAVDTFFFISGLLLTYGYLKAPAKMSPKMQLLGFPMMVVHRYLRLTPAVAVAYFAFITVFRMTGTGPLWDAVGTPLRKQCERHWLSFFLYIQNYVNYDEICLNHTWYLSADMQMFILSPLFLIPVTILIRKHKTLWALYGLATLTAISVVVPLLIRSLDYDMTNFYDTHTRLNDYFIGGILGVILRQYRFKPFPFSKLENLTIWCVALAMCIYINVVYHTILRVYDHTAHTLFYGLYRPLWCASVAWMVYSCYHGYGGPINWILSLPAFQIGGKLSYCMYVLHALVQIYWAGQVRTPLYWSDYANFYVCCGHLIVTMLLSTVWTLAFEMPVCVIEKVLFGGTQTRRRQLAD